MTEILRIMSAKQYFDKYARNGIGKGADRTLIRRQMLDDFRKEIFGLITMRGKKQFDGQVPPEGTPETIQIAKNVIKDEVRKWEKLCKMFSMYRETRNLICENDLKEIIDEYESKETEE